MLSLRYSKHILGLERGDQIKVEMLRLFLAVAQCGNIQQAADENFISRQSLSVMLKNLERELGKTLLVRNNQGVLLTEEGRRFARCAKKVTEAFDEFWSEEGKGERRVLNLYTLPALNEIFAELQGCQIHHKYYLSVQIRETEELIAMFEKKKSGVYFWGVSEVLDAKMLAYPDKVVISRDERIVYFCHRSSKYLQRGYDLAEFARQNVQLVCLGHSFPAAKGISINDIALYKQILMEQGLYASLSRRVFERLGFAGEDWVILGEEATSIVYTAFFCLEDTADEPSLRQEMTELIRQKLLAEGI